MKLLHICASLIILGSYGDISTERKNTREKQQLPKCFKFSAFYRRNLTSYRSGQFQVRRFVDDIFSNWKRRKLVRGETDSVTATKSLMKSSALSKNVMKIDISEEHFEENDNKEVNWKRKRVNYAEYVGYSQISFGTRFKQNQFREKTRNLRYAETKWVEEVSKLVEQEQRATKKKMIQDKKLKVMSKVVAKMLVGFGGSLAGSQNRFCYLCGLGKSRGEGDSKITGKILEVIRNKEGTETNSVLHEKNSFGFNPFRGIFLFPFNSGYADFGSRIPFFSPSSPPDLSFPSTSSMSPVPTLSSLSASIVCDPISSESVQCQRGTKVVLKCPSNT